MHLYMKGTAQGISAIHPSGSFELSIYPRVYGCQATNASPLAFVIVLWYKSPVPWVSRVYGFVHTLRAVICIPSEYKSHYMYFVYSLYSYVNSI